MSSIRFGQGVGEVVVDITRGRRELARDGVTLLRGVLEPHWIEHLRGAVDDAIENPTPLGHRFNSDEGGFLSDMYLSVSSRAFRSFAKDSPIPALCGQLMDVSKVTLFTDELLVKEPGSQLETPWHHDLPYWPIKGAGVASAWIPLDPVTRESGALEFVKGSHLWDRRFRPRDFGTGRSRETERDELPLEAFEAELGNAETLLAEVEPGDCVLFDALTLHRASANAGRGGNRRRAVVLRLVGPAAYYAPRPRTLPLIWGPNIPPGAPLSGELFPTLWEGRLR